MSGELAGTAAPSGAEVRGVGRAVTAMPGLPGAWAGAAWAGTARALVPEQWRRCRDTWCRGSREQRLRCRGGEERADVVRPRISKASRISTMPKGAEWKTPVVPQVSVMGVVSNFNVRRAPVVQKRQV